MIKLPEHLNVIDVSVYWTWMGDDGIVRTKVKPGAEITIKEAHENARVIRSLCNPNKHPLLVDSNKIKSLDKEARDFFAVQTEEIQITSFAILVSSPISRVIGNFFMGLNKSNIPVKLFSEEREAIIWLKQFSIR